MSTSHPARRRTVDPLSITEPVGFLHLEARITPHLATGLRSRAFGDGAHVGTWAPATLRSAWSTMRTALIAAMEATLPADERSPARALHALRTGEQGADVRCLLPDLPSVAASLRKPGASAANAANQVRMLRRALIAGCTDRSPLRVKLAVLPDDWARYIASIDAHHPRIRESIRSGVFKLATAATTAGVRSPVDMPADARKMASWLRDRFPADGDYFAVRSALTRLAKLKVADVAMITVPARRSAAMRLDADGATHEAIADSVTPALAKFARVWDKVAGRGQTGCAPDTLRKLRLGLQRFITYAAHAERAGVLPRGLAQQPTILDWWNTEVAVALATADHARIDLGPQEGDDDIMDTSNTSTTDVGPVSTNAIAAVLAWAARNGLMPKAAVLASGDLPRSVLAELESIWRMTVHWMKDAERRGRLHASTLSAYHTARASYSRARAELRAGAEDGDDVLTIKDKEEAAQMHSLPLLLAVVLPYWTLVHLPRLQAQVDAVTRKLSALRDASPVATHWSDGSHRDEIVARRALTSAIRAWFVFVAFIGDPLRIKNHWAARFGTDDAEVMIEAEYTTDGRIRRIVRMHSRFGGEKFASARNPQAMLKTRDYGTRSWDWPQVVVDHVWLRRYANDVWFPLLQRAGVLPDGATVQSALSENRYALIPTDGGTQRHADGATARRERGAIARYATSQSVRALFREALLTGLRAFGDSALPLTGESVPEDDEAAARRWPWILAPHVVRLWWVTYCLGVLSKNGFSLRRTDPETGESHLVNPIDVAQRATTDTPKTMNKDYEACSDTMHQRTMRTVRDWMHPRAFTEVTDYLVMPDRRPNFAAMWRAWSRQRTDDGMGMLPPEMIRAFTERERGTDLRVPQMRRRAVGQRPPARRRKSGKASDVEA